MTAKRIPTILGVVVLIVGVIGGVILVGQRQGFSLRASPTAVPKQVKVTNVSEKGAVISWITDTNVSGFVKYGEGNGNQNKTQGDDRDRKAGTQGKYTTHYVTLEDLKPNTTYSFGIGSGSKVYTEDGKSYTLKTAIVTTNPPKADTISGKVKLAAGQAAPGVIVYVDVDGLTTMSALSTQQGNWNLTLSNARTTDLQKYAAYDREKAKLTIFVQGGDLGTATATTLSANDSPVDDITLGQNQDFLAASTPIATQSGGLANLAGITIKDNQVSPAELSANPGDVVSIANADTVPHTVTGKSKEFDSGTISPGGMGSIILPLTPGDYAFVDSTQPTVVTMMGVIKVQSQTAPAPATATAQTDGSGFADLLSGDQGATVSGAVTLLNPGNEENIATATPEILVKGPVGKQIKISVHSDNPQTDSLTIDSDGVVGWTPPEGLSPGEHEVTIEYEDEQGILRKIVRKFTVLAATSEVMDELPAFTASPSAQTPTPSKRSTMPATESGIPEPGGTLPTMLLLAMGFLLFSGGIVLQLKGNR